MQQFQWRQFTKFLGDKNFYGVGEIFLLRRHAKSLVSALPIEVYSSTKMYYSLIFLYIL